MNSNIIIRQAENSDLDTIAELFNAYRIFYQKEHDLMLSRTFISERLKKQDSNIFVAITNNNIVGFTQLYPIFSSLSAQKAWILNDLYIIPEARKSGAATNLIKHSIEFCRTQKAGWISLQTTQTNASAQKLYEKIGFRQDNEYLNYILTL